LYFQAGNRFQALLRRSLEMGLAADKILRGIEVRPAYFLIESVEIRCGPRLGILGWLSVSYAYCVIRVQPRLADETSTGSRGRRT
jgi:hypothetical protein